MLTGRKKTTDLYVDRSTQQWVVLDPEGKFWIMPPTEDPWEHRQPFHTTHQTELEPVPGHYKYLVGVPF